MGLAGFLKMISKKNKQAKNMHKIYISKAYGAGESFPHQILGIPFYGEIYRI